MKNLKKRILALVLCLMIVVAIVPVTAFAGDGLHYDESLCFNNCIPGELIVTLYKQYYTLDDEMYGDIAEILPEIEIESYNDLYLSVLTDDQRQVFSKDRPDYAANIGTTFLIILTTKSTEAVEVAINALKDNSFVKWAEPCVYGDYDDVTPNDPKYAPESGTPQWGLPRIGAPEAWEYITGSDATDGSELDNYVKVAVIDSGVDDQHPDLVDNLDMSLAYDAYSVAFNLISGGTYDSVGHGTHVAGIIGAVGNNNEGVAGVCWKVDIVPVKIASSNGSSDPAALLEGINYVSANDILIANVSISISMFTNSVITAVQNYSDYGGLLIKSAGNNGNDIDNDNAFQQLHNIPGVIIVGALKNDSTCDDKASFSNFGDTVVDLFAPGHNIISTVPYSVDPCGYQEKNGTSMAAPFVTGTAALIKSANTGYINITIKKRILDNVTTSTNLTTYCSTGGRLNIPDALYDMGNRVIISDTMTHGTVRPSAIFSKPNTIIYLTAYPDAGYMLKPGTMKHNSNNTITINKWRSFCAMLYVDEVITAQFYMVGDIDFDEAITVADALAALRHYAGTGILTGDAFLAADVDGDGDVDYDDVQYIADYTAHLIDHFPIEE